MPCPDKISTRALGVALLSVSATSADQARHLVRCCGSVDAALLRINEVQDEISRQLSSVAQALRTDPAILTMEMN